MRLTILFYMLLFAMKLLMQRVSEANVSISGELVGEIGQGLLVFLGLEKSDDLALGQKAIKKLLSYRVFADGEGRMNRNVSDIGGGVLLVSQFTLAAETGKGLRPGFSTAMPPAEARVLYHQLLDELGTQHGGGVAAGEFGADMQVSLVNDGPVTFLLEF